MMTGAAMGAAIAGPLMRWRSFKEITANGILGDARSSTAQKGERLLAVSADLLAAELIAGQPWA